MVTVWPSQSIVNNVTNIIFINITPLLLLITSLILLIVHYFIAISLSLSFITPFCLLFPFPSHADARSTRVIFMSFMRTHARRGKEFIIFAYYYYTHYHFVIFSLLRHCYFITEGLIILLFHIITIIDIYY